MGKLYNAIKADQTHYQVTNSQENSDFRRYELIMSNSIMYRPGSIEPHWIKIKGAHIIYYFQDTTGISKVVKYYIETHEKAYVKLNKIFQAILPEKITFFVWNDQALAKRI